MKAREAQLFDDDRPAGPKGPASRPRPFRDHLLDTRAAPIPPVVQGLLWAAAAVVAVLLILAIYRMSQPRAEKTTRAAVSRSA